MPSLLRLRLILILAALPLCCQFSFAQRTALDLDGHPADPFRFQSAKDEQKVVVLIFLRRDCPVSARYAPVIQKISRDFSDVATFWLVYPDRSDTPADIRQYLHDYGYHLPALRDPGRVLVNVSHVQITPEVAVFGRDRHLIYDGRINDWYFDLSRSRPSPTTHELEDAIRAASSGKALAKAEVRGVGCYISDLE